VADRTPKGSHPNDSEVLKLAVVHKKLLKKRIAQSKKTHKLLESLHKKAIEFADDQDACLNTAEKARDAAEKIRIAAAAWKEIARAFDVNMACVRALIGEMESTVQGYVEGAERDASVESDEYDKCDEVDESDEDEYDECGDIDE
jgi:hypothetical protein